MNLPSNDVLTNPLLDSEVEALEHAACDYIATCKYGDNPAVTLDATKVLRLIRMMQKYEPFYDAYFK